MDATKGVIGELGPKLADWLMEPNEEVSVHHAQKFLSIGCMYISNATMQELLKSIQQVSNSQ